MGYQIVYSPEDKRKYPINTPRKRKINLAPLLLLLATVLLLGRPKIRSEVERWLIPGDPQITRAAFVVMIEQLQGGETFGAAVTTFCNEIIAGGEANALYWT